MRGTGVRRALVASDSRVQRDPRVLKQIEWLEAEGFAVDTLGRGDAPALRAGRHRTMPSRPLLVRVAAALLPARARSRVLVDSTIPADLRRPESAAYDLVVVNEVELAPWFAGTRDLLLVEGGRGHLDLHEYSLSQSRTLVHVLLFLRYRRWLAGFVPSNAFDSRTTVAEGIARLWARRYGITMPSIVRNCPDGADVSPAPVDPGDIRLVHHGGASAARRIDLLIRAFALTSPRFSLHLMLVGSPRYIARLRRLAAPLGDRVRFHPPVGTSEVAAALNRFDLEVIFYPPRTENLRYSLPNKFFEAIQGRLGVVVGESPEMAALARRLGVGAVVTGWSAKALAARLEALTAADVAAMKEAAHAAAADSSSEHESLAFLRAVRGG